MEIIFLCLASLLVPIWVVMMNSFTGLFREAGYLHTPIRVPSASCFLTSFVLFHPEHSDHTLRRAVWLYRVYGTLALAWLSQTFLGILVSSGCICC